MLDRLNSRKFEGIQRENSEDRRRHSVIVSLEMEKGSGRNEVKEEMSAAIFLGVSLADMERISKPNGERANYEKNHHQSRNRPHSLHNFQTSSINYALPNCSNRWPLLLREND